MQLTMSGEYALRAMLFMAMQPEDSVFQISDVAAKNDIPDNFLRKIIPVLCKAGLLKSTKGNSGGISFLIPAKDITPLIIIEAVEGKISLNKCLMANEFCSNERWCAVHVVWAKTQAKLRESLSEYSLADLAKQSKRKLSNLH